MVRMVVNMLVFMPISGSIWHTRLLPEELSAKVCVALGGGAYGISSSSYVVFYTDLRVDSPTALRT